jgi:hypothetical protein
LNDECFEKYFEKYLYEHMVLQIEIDTRIIIFHIEMLCLKYEMELGKMLELFLI